MSVVFKYQFESFLKPLSLELPIEAKVLAFQNQFEVPTLWIEFPHDSVETKHRNFFIVGTGHNRAERASYVGTAQFSGGSLVWHCYELGEKKDG